MIAQDAREAFGARIRLARALADLTQEALARKAGVHRNTVSAAERGRTTISVESALRIAAALGIPPGDILAPTPIPVPPPRSEGRRARVDGL